MGATDELIRPSKLVKQLLIEDGICQPDMEKPWCCTTVQMPDGEMVPDNIISVVDREDVSKGRYLSDGAYRLDPHVYIAVRAVGLPKSYDKIRELTDCLDTIRRRVIDYGDNRYCLESAKRTMMIQNRGKDQTNRRYIHLVEYDLHFV